VGHWVKPAPLTEEGPMLSPEDRGNDVIALQTSLREYGYCIAPNGIFDNATREVVTAFQRHFRPQRVDGICDASTRKTLADLLAHRGRPRNIAARAREFSS
jgi:N-acetylmuramoyl-L-alanine amidase